MKTLYPLIWIAFILCLFLVWFFSHRANHKERLMMIDKGIYIDEHQKKKPLFIFPWLKLGILVIGLSIGLFIIAILAKLNLLDGVLPLAILGFCGGIAMVIANNLKSGKSKD